MAGQKIQITIPKKTIQSLADLCEQLGYSKSHIIAMAIDKMANEEKEKNILRNKKYPE